MSASTKRVRPFLFKEAVFRKQEMSVQFLSNTESWTGSPLLLPPAERGVYDAQVLLKFLGGTATGDRYKHYTLRNEREEQAHESLLSVLGIAQPDLSEPNLTEELQHAGIRNSGKLERQIIDHEDTGPLIFYRASRPEIKTAAQA
jgi:hypothetical protein